jgi:hypothetical protein
VSARVASDTHDYFNAEIVHDFDHSPQPSRFEQFHVFDNENLVKADI